MPGFQSIIFEVATEDGRNFKLMKPVTYIALDGTVFVIPKGASTDGASTPAELWPLIPPFGNYWPAAFLHDAAYQNTLELTNGNKANLPKDRCDDLLKEAMISLGVPVYLVQEIYDGVKFGGWSAFREDRS